MENFLLKYMSQMLFLFSGIVFLVWLFQFIEIPYIECLQISFLKTYKYEGVISTFQMFTTLGAIFAFWFGYKRYEKDKEFELIKDFGLTQLQKLNFKKWMLIYLLHQKGYIDSKIYEIYELEQGQELFEEIIYYSKGGDPICFDHMINISYKSEDFRKHLNKHFQDYREYPDENIRNVAKELYEKTNF